MANCLTLTDLHSLVRTATSELRGLRTAISAVGNCAAPQLALLKGTMFAGTIALEDEKGGVGVIWLEIGQGTRVPTMVQSTGSSACVEWTRNPDNKAPPPQEGWDKWCDDACTDDGQGNCDPYPGQCVCKQPQPPAPKKTMYSCTDYKCVDNAQGPFATRAACEATCNAPPPPIPVYPTTMYSCTDYKCVENAQGPFATRVACEATCKAKLPPEYFYECQFFRSMPAGDSVARSLRSEVMQATEDDYSKCTLVGQTYFPDSGEGAYIQFAVQHQGANGVDPQSAGVLKVPVNADGTVNPRDPVRYQGPIPGSYAGYGSMKSPISLTNLAVPQEFVTKEDNVQWKDNAQATRTPTPPIGISARFRRATYTSSDPRYTKAFNLFIVSLLQVGSRVDQSCVPSCCSPAARACVVGNVWTAPMTSKTMLTNDGVPQKWYVEYDDDGGAGQPDLKITTLWGGGSGMPAQTTTVYANKEGGINGLVYIKPEGFELPSGVLPPAKDLSGYYGDIQDALGDLQSPALVASRLL